MPLTSLSPVEALYHLERFSDWEAFVEEVDEVKARIDLSCVSDLSGRLKTLSSIPSHLIDNTYASNKGQNALLL